MTIHKLSSSPGLPEAEPTLEEALDTINTWLYATRNDKPGAITTGRAIAVLVDNGQDEFLNSHKVAASTIEKYLSLLNYPLALQELFQANRVSQKQIADLFPSNQIDDPVAREHLLNTFSACAKQASAKKKDTPKKKWKFTKKELEEIYRLALNEALKTPPPQSTSVVESLGVKEPISKIREQLLASITSLDITSKHIVSRRQEPEVAEFFVETEESKLEKKLVGLARRIEHTRNHIQQNLEDISLQSNPPISDGRIYILKDNLPETLLAEYSGLEGRMFRIIGAHNNRSVIARLEPQMGEVVIELVSADNGSRHDRFTKVQAHLITEVAQSAPSPEPHSSYSETPDSTEAPQSEQIKPTVIRRRKQR